MPDDPPSAGGGVSLPAVLIALLGVGALALALVLRLTAPAGTPSEPVGPAEGAGPAPVGRRPVEPDPFVGVPAVDAPVHVKLRAVADLELPAHERLKPLVDGGLPLVSEPQDVALVRRILRDPREGDTIRNEAANLLYRSEVSELADDLKAVLVHPLERERFRSFAAQHLGVIWLGGGAEDPALRDDLRRLLTDRHPAVRREALWPLAQGNDPLAVDTAVKLLSDPGAGGMHDLCCRIAALKGLEDLLPRIRELAAEAEEVPRSAALHALAALGGAAEKSLIARAVDDENPRVAAAARAALTALDGAKPETQP